MKEKLKILHLEDNDADAELIHTMLEHGNISAEIYRAKDKESYLKQIEMQDYDLVISDYSIPQFDGLKALIEAKKKNKFIPFIFCSGTIGEDRAVQCLQLGAMDYVIKDRLDRLVPAVNRAMRLVSEIKKKEKAEAELAQIRFAIENTSEPIFITTSENIIQYVNPSFTEMYGWSAEEVIGKHTPGILKSNQHDDTFYETFRKNMALQKPFSMEMVNRTKKGKLIEIKNMISPMLNDNNVLAGYVYIQTDISLRKLQELEVMRAKHEAEEMNKLKSYFLSNISHEMRTPLISILGFSEVLKDELIDKEHADAAKYIYDSGIRLQKTISSILSLQDIESEKLEITNDNMNLIELLDNVSAKYKKEAVKKGILFKTYFNCEEAWIKTDRYLLTKVLSNILDNAIKFTKQGEISFTLLTQVEKNHSYAIINITDSGVGISPNKIAQAFIPFRQGSEGLSRAYEGMGLGLYISKQILELLHGQIKIESQIGKGTQVEIKIPILPPEKEITQEINAQKTLITETRQDQTLDKPSILLVEDNEGNRKVFNRFLRNDFLVDNAEDGISAISKADLKKYDLILMDINLGPGIDGMEAFRRIRKLPNCKEVPVIAVTAYTMQSDKQKFLNYGFTGYIQKTVMKEDLIAFIKSMLNYS